MTELPATTDKPHVRITHTPSGLLLAEGPLGWGVTGFEGNLYISAQYLRTDRLVLTPIPGICFYKFVYLWMDLKLPAGGRSRMLGWKYVVPNPLFPFIAFRAALPRSHPELDVVEFQPDADPSRTG